jgi:MoaA/NifB/PqqE/SkfB family radical SAM enzyme
MFKCYAANGYVSIGNDYFKPCCMSTKKFSLDIENLNQARIMIQKELETNSWPDSCSWCKDLEINSKKSLRNKIEKLFPIIYNYNLNENGLQYLELMIDNTCNMNCIMCNQNFSSKWNSILKTNSNINNYKKIIELLKNSNTSNLRVIRILGGEPFYSKNVIDFLENIEKYITNNISNITLLFNTNCSIFPKKIVNLLKKFKSVHITISIDGIEEVAEYFRPGVSWQNIQEVYRQWQNFSIENKYLMTIQSCLHIGNIEHKDNLNYWYKNNKCNGLTINFVNDDHLCVSNLYQSFLNKFNIDYRTKTHINYNKIFSYIDFFDNISKTKFAKISPLVYNQLEFQRNNNV